MVKGILISPILLGLVACGSGSNSGSHSETGFEQSLLGQWEQPCTPQQGNNAQKMTMEFSPDQQAQISLTSFSDSSCEFPSLLLSVNGHYTTAEMSDASSNALFMIDFEWSQSYIGFTDASIIEIFNSSDVCGYNDWAQGQLKEITGCPDAFTSVLEEDLLMPVLIEGNRLYITDGSLTSSAQYLEKIE